jgi:hypothetical protein
VCGAFLTERTYMVILSNVMSSCATTLMYVHPSTRNRIETDRFPLRIHPSTRDTGCPGPQANGGSGSTHLSDDWHWCDWCLVLKEIDAILDVQFLDKMRWLSKIDLSISFNWPGAIRNLDPYLMLDELKCESKDAAAGFPGVFALFCIAG